MTQIWPLYILAVSNHMCVKVLGYIFLLLYIRVTNQTPQEVERCSVFKEVVGRQQDHKG